jgi:hypothetical protein
MAGPRDRRATPDESRRFTPEEAEECSTRLRRRITEVQNPELKSARYDDPRIVTLEKAIRATVADIFGSMCRLRAWSGADSGSHDSESLGVRTTFVAEATTAAR